MRITHLALAAALAGCGNGEPTRLEASATADSCGSTRDATSEEEARVHELMALGESIDKRYPPSPIPFKAPSWKVARIADNGVIELVDGRRIVMDGVSCTAEGIGYLRRVIIDEDTTLAISPHSPGNPIEAEVWTVTTLKLEDRETQSYSAIAETALKSGWCVPKVSETNPHNNRYEALAREFGALGEAQEKLRANKALQPTPSRCALGRG
jgi:hypothetical protein